MSYDFSKEYRERLQRAFDPLTKLDRTWISPSQRYSNLSIGFSEETIQSLKGILGENLGYIFEPKHLYPNYTEIINSMIFPMKLNATKTLSNVITQMTDISPSRRLLPKFGVPESLSLRATRLSDMLGSLELEKLESEPNELDAIKQEVKVQGKWSWEMIDRLLQIVGFILAFYLSQMDSIQSAKQHQEIMQQNEVHQQQIMQQNQIHQQQIIDQNEKHHQERMEQEERHHEELLEAQITSQQDSLELEESIQEFLEALKPYFSSAESDTED